MANNIEDNTNNVVNEAERRALEILKELTLLTESYAKKECPVKTGTLRRSVYHEIDIVNLIARIGSNIEYAPHVELGTSKMAARPFLRLALHRVMVQDAPRILAEK
jgi:HK97 gp10 family phage protein